MSFTPRGEVLNHLSTHRGITENPAGSNTDNRPNDDDSRWGIRKAQLACAGGGTWLVGTAWCGEWAYWALSQASVQNISYRLASVSLIEDDARAKRGPFFDWQPPSNWEVVLRGDLAVCFARGVHVEVVRSFFYEGGRRYVVTDGGNTSAGVAGSQANGGGAFRRERPLSDVYGFARVDYPGGPETLEFDQKAMKDEEELSKRRVERIGLPPESSGEPGAVSDELLLQALAEVPEAEELLAEISL